MKVMLLLLLIWQKGISRKVALKMKLVKLPTRRERFSIGVFDVVREQWTTSNEETGYDQLRSTS
jgi:hypothetical protein